MKCPNCKNEMVEGTFPLIMGKTIKWTEKAKFTDMKFPATKNIIAYRCPKCGKVELTTEVK